SARKETGTVALMSQEGEEAAAVQCPVRAALNHLCQELNLDVDSASEALRDFTALRGTYSLEGDIIHWLACALYVACRRSVVPTVGSSLMKGNCVSLTRILRSAKLSLIQFFSKMKKWMDMSNLCQEFRERVEKLERNFEVSTVIFKKYTPIFLDIFKNPYEEQPKFQRSRKQRRVPCSAKDLFNFCWTLFVYTKGNFSMIGDDLVNSYHLLLCCLDMVFANALLCLQEDFHTTDFRTSERPPCIISTLCELHDGLLVDAKGIKEHYFKPYISKLYDRKILKGDCLLDPSNFVNNNKALNKEYEEYVLTKGDFDERVFLGADAEEEIGTPQKCCAATPCGNIRAHAECHLQQHFEKRSFAPSTPLTGRNYLKDKESVITPVASATQSVSRLQSIVAGLKNAPSEQLVAIFESCIRNPMENILKGVKKIGYIFCQNYTLSVNDQLVCHLDFALHRLKLAEILYYKSLETIMIQEKRRLPGKDMSTILEQDIFHCSLLACCFEIVLFAYRSPRTFPWIIDILNVKPFYFYKVIEVLIRSEEGLSRDMVKHLNSIEEQILENLAWREDSVLWDALQASEDEVPRCEEVIFPSNFETGNGGKGLGYLPMMPASPIMHPRVKEVRTNHEGSHRQDLQLLSPISIHDRYNSPMAGSAKRRLFGDESPPTKPVEKKYAEAMKLTTDKHVSVSPDEIALSMAQTAVTRQKTGRITLIPIAVISEDSKVDSYGQVPLSADALMTVCPSQPPPSEPFHSTGNKPKKTGSLALFFRKVYNLASVRLRDLCSKLDVSNDLRGKIWTCFEFTLVHCTDLMKERHLDQLLLCAFYIMAKVSKEERTFQDIMKSYRNQPQANSYVYRSVLLKKVQADMNHYRDFEKEERGDLIMFYNTIYVKKVINFVLKYVSNHDYMVEAPPLSPFPSIKQLPISPRRISQQHSLYVSPHKNGSCLTPKSALLYKFNGSPSKSLKEINNMIKQEGQRPKKRAISIDSDTDSPAKRLCQENDDVLLKRLQDVVSERANH
uniref:Retinoblastoma-like protein 1 n=1 Tax=Naja naja TaxID=35670 RepID=A0A8C6XF46_NAJNA